MCLVLALRLPLVLRSFVDRRSSLNIVTKERARRPKTLGKIPGGAGILLHSVKTGTEVERVFSPIRTEEVQWLERKADLPLRSSD